MSLTITRAQQAQIPEIVDLINAAFWPSHSQFLREEHPDSKLRVRNTMIGDALEDKQKEFYVAVDTINQCIAGTILLEVKGDIAKFNLLAKKVNYKNLGDQLIDHIVARVKVLGISVLKIDVVDCGESESQKLIKYYEQRGFEKTGNQFAFPRSHCLKENFKNKVFLIEMQRKIN